MCHDCILGAGIDAKHRSRNPVFFFQPEVAPPSLVFFASPFPAILGVGQHGHSCSSSTLHIILQK